MWAQLILTSTIGTPNSSWPTFPPRLAVYPDSAPCRAGTCSTPAEFFEGSRAQWKSVLTSEQRLSVFRVGPAGDGAKYLWNPAAVLPRQPACLVVSVGSNGDYRFEDAVHALAPACEVHTIDGTLTAKQAERAPGYITLHRANLCTSSTDCEKDLKALSFQEGGQSERKVETGKSLKVSLGDLFAGRRIDVLKIDCESCEFTTVAQWFDSQVCIEQIAVEVHAQYICHGCPKQNNVQKAHWFLAQLLSRGYEIIKHVRGAHGDNPGMREISLVRRERCSTRRRVASGGD